MFLIVDTREHKQEWERIKKQFDTLGVPYDRCKLYCGDYQDVTNSLLVIDRKQDLQELCSNVCQQHERFQKELMRARSAGIHIVFLCEHGPDIKTLEDVQSWPNPRRLPRIGWVNGKRQQVVDSPNALTGEQLYKTLKTISNRYGVEFLFCSKDETGSKIVEILSRGKKDDKEPGRDRET
jgi:hypothetical protein